MLLAFPILLPQYFILISAYSRITITIVSILFMWAKWQWIESLEWIIEMTVLFDGTDVCVLACMLLLLVFLSTIILSIFILNPHIIQSRSIHFLLPEHSLPRFLLIFRFHPIPWFLFTLHSYLLLNLNSFFQSYFLTNLQYLLHIFLFNICQLFLFVYLHLFLFVYLHLFYFLIQCISYFLLDL